jgi:hypothetical protein
LTDCRNMTDEGLRVLAKHTTLTLFTLPPAILQTAVRLRLREAQLVALPVTRSSCGHALDEAATHYIHCRGAPGVGEGNFFTSIHDAMLGEVRWQTCSAPCALAAKLWRSTTSERCRTPPYTART